MHPLVLIQSFGQEKASNIVKELLRANEDTNEIVTLSIDDFNLRTHKLNISTKYYKTQVLLYECEDITAINKSMKNSIEGSIIYFDADDRGFLDKVKPIIEYMQDNNIELPTLVSRDLNRENSLSYEEILKSCKVNLSIIDLNESFDSSEVSGYKELLEHLKNHVWSTVEIEKNNTTNEEDNINCEEALNEFEDLLNRFQQFKVISQTLSREEVLQNAEHLAELFEKIINED